jgi:hypothetical protein
MKNTAQFIIISQLLPLVSKNMLDSLKYQRRLLIILETSNGTLQHTHTYFKYIE